MAAPHIPGRHPHTFEKPKHALLTGKRLFAYIRQQWLLLVIILVSLMISSASSLAGSYFAKPLINNYILPGNMEGLFYALLALGGVYLVGVLAALVQTRISVRLTQKIIYLLRRDLFVALQRLPLAYFDTHTHGELMSRFTNDVDTVQSMLEQSLTQLFSSAIIFVGSIVLMLSINPLLFSITAVVILIMVGLSGKIGSKSRTNFQQQQKIMGKLNGYVEEAVGGIKEIKVFGHELPAEKEFNLLNERYQTVSIRAQFMGGIIMPIMNNLNNICYALIATLGGIFTFTARLDVGSLVVFLQLSRQIGQPINQITGQLNNVFSALAGAERLFEVMDQEPEENSGEVQLVKIDSTDTAQPEAWVWRTIDEQQRVTDIPLTGDVRFNQVTFGYADSIPVLTDISLFAKPGQTIALVGSTGAGKTTITQLINRFYEIQTGTITYDGIDIQTIKKQSLRQSLGVVLQDTHLFTGTVIDNIRYGNLGASDEMCIVAAKMACADSFISRLPQGYQTRITADGINLSQGQRQLIAIARVCVADPPVMILDEATSSIDTRTEQLIQKGLRALMNNRTVFVIAHRLSTVRNADAILVIEHGAIVERGNHESLLAQKGRYYQLYKGAVRLE